MEIILKGHDRKYEVEQTGMLFFAPDSDAVITSSLAVDGDIFTAKAAVCFEGKTGEYTESAVCTGIKQEKNLIKRTILRAAQKISDNVAPWGILTGIRPVKPIKEKVLEGMADEEIKDFFSKEYLVSDEKIRLALDVAKNEIRLVPDKTDKISIYISIPFCPTRCLYCSFISGTLNKNKDIQGEYVECLEKEMELTSKILEQKGLEIDTVYIGGGTPTALAPLYLDKMLGAADKYFAPSKTAEFTVEAGRPDTVTEEKLEILKKYGVNRISINPQTTHDKTLEIIGRRHTVEEFYKAFELARGMGFDNINTDLISGLPGENAEMFGQTLAQMERLAPESLTVHTLYIKRASYLRHADIKLPDTIEVAQMMADAQECAERMGMTPYYMYKQRSTLGNLENIGFAARGRECIYNINSMGDLQTVIALGGGGVTKLVYGDRIERVFNFKNPDEYIKNMDEMLNRKLQTAEMLGGING
ncbi:MAG: coproporphyrinogen dehydrogenase HemZ [Clostridia bacterium]|nr:coproporphyrinogen dehydrogenase HemZ [Clostridia bacterium]